MRSALPGELAHPPAHHPTILPPRLLSILPPCLPPSGLSVILSFRQPVIPPTRHPATLPSLHPVTPIYFYGFDIQYAAGHIESTNLGAE